MKWKKYILQYADVISLNIKWTFINLFFLTNKTQKENGRIKTSLHNWKKNRNSN